RPPSPWLDEGDPAVGLFSCVARRRRFRLTFSAQRGPSGLIPVPHPYFQDSPPMIRSPLMTVMTDAVMKASRSLKRDFGEVENLQVSRKGPGDFVSAADRKAEQILRDALEKARPGYGFVMEESGVVK